MRLTWGQGLPFQKVEHRVTTTDVQPSNQQGGILVMVTGALMIDDQQQPMSYAQTFQLAQGERLRILSHPVPLLMRGRWRKLFRPERHLQAGVSRFVSDVLGCRTASSVETGDQRVSENSRERCRLRVQCNRIGEKARRQAP